MIYSRLPLLCVAILCCASNAEPLPAPAGTSRVLLDPSSTTSLQQQDVSTSSPTILPSSSSKPSDPSSSSSISTSSSVAASQSSPSTTSTLSSNTVVWGPLGLPPAGSTSVSTTQVPPGYGGVGPFISSQVNFTSDVESGSGTSPSTALVTSSVVWPSDGKGGPTPTGIPLKSGGRSTGSAPTAVGPTIVQGSTTFNIPLPSTTPPPNTTTSNCDSTPPPSLATGNTSPHSNTSSPSPLSSEYDNSTSTKPHTKHNSTTIFHTTSSHHTKTHKPTTSHHYHNTSTTCTPWIAGETITIWSIVPNTHTTTITLTANQTNTFTTTPEFTPPIPVCTLMPNSPYSSLPSSSEYPWGPESSSTIVGLGESTAGAAASSFSINPFQTVQPPEPTDSASPNSPPTGTLNFLTPPVTTAVITSKNPVTMFTTVSAPAFPGNGKTEKQSAVPTTVLWTALPPPPPPPADTGSASTTAPSPDDANPGSGGGSGPGLGLTVGPNTATVGTVILVVRPNSVAIGSQTVAPLPSGSSTTVTEGGETFTVNPSQVIGPGTVVTIPSQTTSGGGVFMESPFPTVVDGISVSVGGTQAVVGGSTFAIGVGAPEQTIVINKENVSIGPGGVGLADVTLTPAAALPTNVVLFDGQVFSAVGASVAVFDGTSITFTGGAPVTTVFNGDTITIGPSGIIDGTSTLGGTAHLFGTQLGIAGGIQVSEIGSTLAVIDGTTLTIGPGATESVATVDGKTITAASSGLIIDGSTTLAFPFNPTTQEVTAGGVTFSEIGSSLVDIGGTTFTIGPGAATTTEVYNGQTISLGPGGIGFATTTLTSFVASSTASPTNKKKNGGAALGSPFSGILGVCIAFGVGFLI